MDIYSLCIYLFLNIFANIYTYPYQKYTKKYTPPEKKETPPGARRIQIYQKTFIVVVANRLHMRDLGVGAPPNLISLRYVFFDHHVCIKPVKFTLKGI
jgi:hypothetical protein